MRGTTVRMGRSRRDAGFTLIELLVVVGMVVVVIATLGVFFLAGPSPAVASASRDIGAAFAEARETAVAFSEATVVFTSAGSGYSARVYREMPGDGQFHAVDGPSYDSTVAIEETAAPLGAPGFAFRVDSRGSVTGYAHFAPADTTFSLRSCPPTGAFVLSLAYGKQQRTVAIPCTITLSAVTAGLVVTPAPAATPAPDAPGTCPPTESCGTPLPAFVATCPPGYTPDAVPNVCDSPTPVPTATPTAISTCPPGSTGTYPNCLPAPPTPSPAPTPTSTSTPSWIWTANMTQGAHPVLGVGWAYWVAVDIEQNGELIASDVCYGAGGGLSINWSTVALGDDATIAVLTAANVPLAFATQVLSDCASFRYPSTNPLMGWP